MHVQNPRKKTDGVATNLSTEIGAEVGTLTQLLLTELSSSSDDEKGRTRTEIACEP